MRCLKLFAVIGAMATVLLVAASGQASATVLCKTTSTPCSAADRLVIGSTVTSALAPETKSVLHTAYKNVECSNSSLTTTLTNAGSGTGTVRGSIDTLTLQTCNCTVTVLKKGTFELHHISSTDNGTITATGTEVTTNCSTIFGTVHCIYATEATDLGTFKGGSPAKLSISSELVPLSTSGLCSEESRWEAEYEVTSPKPLYVEPEALTGSVLCTATSTPCPEGSREEVGAEIKMTLVTHSTIERPPLIKNVTCEESSITATLTNSGSASENVQANVEGWTFAKCNNCTVITLNTGTLELRHSEGTENATVMSNGTTVTTFCTLSPVGTVHCNYVTENDAIGTLVGGSSPRLQIKRALRREMTSSLCDEEATWIAEYKITSPSPLYVEPE
jgi:hypothetical protein